MEYRDYYQILGVSEDASQEEIQQAFRKAARKHHPDVNPDDPQAEERFKEINEAYQVLSDPEKRGKYDRFGSQWKQYQQAGGEPEDFNWSQWAPGGRSGQQTGYTTRQVNQEEFEQMFGQGGAGFSDFFESLFGGAGPGRSSSGPGFRQRETYRPFGGRNRRARAGRDLETTVKISLEEAFQGTERIIEKSSGRKMKAKIPPGVHTGSRVRLEGQGQPGQGGQPSGDLYLHVEVVPDPDFEREDDDLHTTREVNLYTLILGGEVPVSTLEKQVKLHIPPGTQNGTSFRLRGQGMPKLNQEDERGDLYVQVKAVLPESLSEEEREHFTALQKLQDSA